MRTHSIATGWLLAASLIMVTRGQAASSVEVARYDAAIAFYTDKLEADPHDFLTAATLGEMYLGKARLTGNGTYYLKAERAYRRSLTIMPKNNIEARIGLAAALTAQHRFREAKDGVRAARLEEPENLTLVAIAGDVEFDLGDYASAGGYYKLYAKAKPGLESWSRLAKIEMLYGSRERAEELWENCTARPVGSNPEPSAWAWVMRGAFYLGLGKLTEATMCYDRALAVLPDYSLALEHKAEIKVIEKKFDEAIGLFRQAIAFSSNPQLWIFLGDAFERAGQHDSALSAWRQGESRYRNYITKGHNQYLRHLALFYLDHNLKPKKALELAQKDSKIRQDYGSYLTLARAYLGLGKTKQAIGVIEKAQPEAVNDAVFCYYAGQIYLANGKTAEAGRLLTRASELCPLFDRMPL